MTKKPDYAFKAKVMASPLYQDYRQIKKSIYAELALERTGEVIKHRYDYGTALDWQSLLSKQHPREWNECGKISHSNSERTCRIRKRIATFLEDGNCVFLTLTFNPDTLDNTSADTRRQYVRRYLNSLNAPYVANIDFGKKNGREHYHAVVRVNRVDFKGWHKYGAINGEDIHHAYDIGKLSNYITKLTRHAIKETTKRSVVLYSR